MKTWDKVRLERRGNKNTKRGEGECLPQLKPFKPSRNKTSQPSYPTYDAGTASLLDLNKLKGAREDKKMKKSMTAKPHTFFKFSSAQRCKEEIKKIVLRSRYQTGSLKPVNLSRVSVGRC